MFHKEYKRMKLFLKSQTVQTLKKYYILLRKDYTRKEYTTNILGFCEIWNKAQKMSQTLDVHASCYRSNIYFHSSSSLLPSVQSQAGLYT